MTLPRGPHSLTREQVADSQRTRLLRACGELLADGWGAVTIGELARRAGVSRGAFYAHFADKEACALAAYADFAAGLAAAMGGAGDPLAAYLEALARDPQAARAFIVEFDGAGPAARARRREAIHAFAALLAARHAAMRERDPSLGELPERAYLGLALGVREMVREQLETDPSPDLAALAPDIRTWVAAMVTGA